MASSPYYLRALAEDQEVGVSIDVSIWGKIIGGVAGFALGGPMGALLGAAFGHAVDRNRAHQRGGQGPASQQSKQTAFTIAVIVLNAKMAKADGQVTREEIETFKRIYQIPADEIGDVGRLWNQAKQDVAGFEPYAREIGKMFSHDPAVLENLLGGLFHIALADGVMHPNELKFLEKVASEFGFDRVTFDRVRASFAADDGDNPFDILGVTRDTPDDEIKKMYRKLIRENHPDTLIAKGMPQEFVDIANEKTAAINAAYDEIEKERAL